MPLVRVEGLNKFYKGGRRACMCCAISRSRSRPARWSPVVGAFRRGQEHAAARAGRARSRPIAAAWKSQGADLADLSDAALVAFRNTQVGFVFQFHHLLPEFTRARERRDADAHRRDAAAGSPDARRRAADARGPGRARSTHRPSMLSGGEQQRVAVRARARHAAALLLADEPTGDLDEPTAESLHDLLRQMHARARTHVGRLRRTTPSWPPPVIVCCAWKEGRCGLPDGCGRGRRGGSSAGKSLGGATSGIDFELSWIRRGVRRRISAAVACQTHRRQGIH